MIAKARVLALLREWSQRVFKGSLAGLKQPWVRPGPGPAWARGRDPNKLRFYVFYLFFLICWGSGGGGEPFRWGPGSGPGCAEMAPIWPPMAPRRPQLGNPTKRLPHRGPTTSNRTFQRSTNATSLYIHIYIYIHIIYTEVIIYNVLSNYICMCIY